MKKLLKGVSLVLMICMLCCTMSVFASAQLVPEITPFWVNIDSITLTITFNGSTSFTRGLITRQSGVTLMEGTITLYKYVNSQWVYVNQWSGSSTGNSLIITGYFSCISGIEYKSVLNVTAYRGTAAESETVTTYKTCP